MSAGELEPRLTTAVMTFMGAPGREREAAEAWAFELTWYFLRGVGEQPAVTYQDGLYTVTGLMQTTHPGDTVPVTIFTGTGDLGYCTNPERRARLKELASARDRFDGRAITKGRAG